MLRAAGSGTRHGRLRSPVAERRMKTRSIITERDVPRNISLRLLPRRINRPVKPLDLHRSIERLGQALSKQIPVRPDGLPDPETPGPRRTPPRCNYCNALSLFPGMYTHIFTG